MKLTQKFCNLANLKPKYYFDDAISGFGLRVYAGGARTWIIYSRQGSKKIYKSIGNAKEISLENARSIALDIKSKINLKDSQNICNISQAAENYLTQHAILHKRTWKDDEYYIKNHIIPHFGNYSLASLTTSEIANYHSKLTKPYAANRLLKVLSAIYSHVAHIGTYVGQNPCKGVRPYREESRCRYLTREEVNRLIEAVKSIKAIEQKTAILLLLYTGCRRGEILSLRWDQVNIERAELYLQRTKNGKPRTVPLTTPASEVLAQLPKKCQWCFPAPTGDKPLHEIRRTWKRVCRLANLTNLRIHDLRRTVGSLLVQDGVSLPIIAAILGHSNTYVTHIYARLNANVERAGLEHFSKLIGDN